MEGPPHCEEDVNEAELRAREQANTSKAELHKEEGNARYKAKQYRASIADYTKAIECGLAEKIDDAKQASYCGNRAAAHLMLREPLNAIEDCRSALVLDPLSGKFHQRLCAAQLQLADFHAALETANEGVAKDGLIQKESLSGFRETVKQLRAQWEEGEASMVAGQYGKAMRVFKEMEERGVSASEKLSLHMGRCRMMQGDYLPVMMLTKDVLRQNPQCIEAYVLRAEALYMNNVALCDSSNFDEKLQEGLRLLKQALGYDPDHAEAQRARKKLKCVSDSVASVRVKMENREFDEARALLEKALLIDPANKRLLGRLYEQRAKANLRMHEYQLAIKDATQATYHDHELVAAYMTRASAYQNLGKHEEAVKTLESLAHWCREELIMKRLHDARFLLRKANRCDLYALLGVPSVASQPEINRAFREKASEWHPDKKGHLDDVLRKNAEEMFKRINEAHEILTDPLRKGWYDEGYDEEGIKEKLEEKKMRDMQRQHHHR